MLYFLFIRFRMHIYMYIVLYTVQITGPSRILVIKVSPTSLQLFVIGKILAPPGTTVQCTVHQSVHNNKSQPYLNESETNLRS